MTGNTLDPYSGRYAQRTDGLAVSEIRALFSVANRPEVVSLAGGMPYTAALPLDAVGRCWASWSPTTGAPCCSTARVRATSGCASSSAT